MRQKAPAPSPPASTTAATARAPGPPPSGVGSLSPVTDAAAIVAPGSAGDGVLGAIVVVDVDVVDVEDVVVVSIAPPVGATVEDGPAAGVALAAGAGAVEGGAAAGGAGAGATGAGAGSDRAGAGGCAAAGGGAVGATGGDAGQIRSIDRNDGGSPLPQRQPSTAPSVTVRLPAPAAASVNDPAPGAAIEYAQ